MVVTYVTDLYGSSSVVRPWGKAKALSYENVEGCKICKREGGREVFHLRQGYMVPPSAVHMYVYSWFRHDRNSA